MANLNSGDAKVEFFTNFDFIKSKFDADYIVATKLYKVMQNEYVHFNKYFIELYSNKIPA